MLAVGLLVFVLVILAAAIADAIVDRQKEEKSRRHTILRVAGALAVAGSMIAQSYAAKTRQAELQKSIDTLAEENRRRFDENKELLSRDLANRGDAESQKRLLDMAQSYGLLLGSTDGKGAREDLEARTQAFKRAGDSAQALLKKKIEESRAKFGEATALLMSYCDGILREAGANVITKEDLQPPFPESPQENLVRRVELPSAPDAKLLINHFPGRIEDYGLNDPQIEFGIQRPGHPRTAWFIVRFEHEPVRRVRLIAQAPLQHLYNKNTGLIDERPVEQASDPSFLAAYGSAIKDSIAVTQADMQRANDSAAK